MTGLADLVRDMLPTPTRPAPAPKPKPVNDKARQQAIADRNELRVHVRAKRLTNDNQRLAQVEAELESWNG
jgi:hypothetical protein